MESLAYQLATVPLNAQPKAKLPVVPLLEPVKLKPSSSVGIDTKMAGAAVPLDVMFTEPQHVSKLVSLTASTL